MKRLIIVVFTFTVILFSGCTQNKQTVTVYTSVDRVFSEPVLKKFEKETGIKVKALYDTEETKSTGVVNRIIAEKNNPQCDVFWSGDPVRVVVLKKKGLTQAFSVKNSEGISNIFRDPENHWVGFSARARVIIFNKKKLGERPIPKSIFDFTKLEYKNDFAIANPLFGTTTFHIAALFSLLGNTKAEALINKWKANGMKIVASNGDVKSRVLKGEIACGLTDTDDAFEAKKESEDVDFVFPDQNGIGTLIMPNAVVLIKNSPHTENALKLINYLLSPETEEMLAKSCAQMPLHKGVSVPRDVPSLDKIVPMNIDYEKTADKLIEIKDYLKTIAE